MDRNQQDGNRPLIGRRVLIVSHGFQSAYERGFTNALASNGAGIVLAGSDKTELSRLHPATVVRNIRGSQDASRPKWKKAWNMLCYHARLIRLAWDERRSTIHVIGLTDFAAITGILEALYFRAVARKYMLTVHNLLPHDRTGWWYRAVYKLVYRIPHQLVVHTHTMADELSTGFQVASKRMVVMEHGCELDDGLMLASRAPRAPRQHEVRLLFFGGVAPYKGLDLLLQSMALLPPQFNLRICGYCRSEVLATELRQQMEGLGSRHPTTWRNEYVSDQDMAAEMNDADILVMPYRHIDQSGVIFQAMKFGVPVVATRVGELARLVTPQSGEICEPNDVPALAHAIQTLAARLHLLSRESIAALAAAYDWRYTVRVLENAYA